MISRLRDLAKSLTLLYVEDDDKTRQEMTILLKKFFAHVDICENGALALEKFKTHSYDIVATDISMPIMNGLDLLKEINHINSQQCTIVISAHNDTSSLIQSIELGVNHFILKPVNKNQLIETLSKACASIITTRELQKAQLLYTDALTNLPNRSRLIDDVNVGEYSALWIINIDSFRQTNGFYGEKVGNMLLCESANRLKPYAQSQKMVLYRSGGDEFVLAGLEILSPDEAQTIALTLIQLFSRPFLIENFEISLSITLGISQSSCRDEAQELYQHALQTLKLAKEKKKNYLFYEPTLFNNDYENNILWSKKVKDALVTERIIPYFQPIINVKTRAIEKYEALVRMIDTDGKIIPPSHFLTIAKQSKLYPLITKSVLIQSFETFHTNNYEFSINLCAQDILDSETVSTIYEVLEMYKNSSHRVVFEIVESEGIDNYDDIIHFIHHVKTYGAKIAIDDFGSGYSNFMHVLQLGADYLKIDGSIIAVLSTPNGLATAEAVVLFAQKLGLKTIAEFVENEEIFSTLQHLGIDYAQGYLFGKPEATLL